MSDAERKAQRLLALIDREGQPPFPINDWLTLLQEVHAGIQARIDAAKEDTGSSDQLT